MAKENLTKSANIAVTAREIDFVTRFGQNWEHLMNLLGIMRPIKKENGAVLKSKKGVVTLQSGEVGEGEEIPYSVANVTEQTYEEMSIEKYAKATSIEAIKEHGYDNAVAKTDNAFLYELQNKVCNKFYDYLTTAQESVQTANTFQLALAKAKGTVINEFKKLHLTCTEIVAFVNVMDVYNYLGEKDITIESKFGFQYIKDFMGYRVVFLLSDNEIEQGQVIATPVENIVLYYVDPSDSDFVKAGLVYRTAGETPLIGFHAQGNYNTAVSEVFAIMGMTLFAEYVNGIAVYEVSAGA